MSKILDDFRNLRLCRAVERYERGIIEELEGELARLRRQLPDGMKHCTITFHECSMGHGWLSATNWKTHPCQKCALTAAEDKLAAIQQALDCHHYGSGDATVGVIGDILRGESRQ